jgi:hypothetical protein
MKDTSHPAFNIPPKKVRKSTWCNNFLLPEKTSEIDKYRASLFRESNVFKRRYNGKVRSE